MLRQWNLNEEVINFTLPFGYLTLKAESFKKPQKQKKKFTIRTHKEDWIHFQFISSQTNCVDSYYYFFFLRLYRSSHRVQPACDCNCVIFYLLLYHKVISGKKKNCMSIAESYAIVQFESKPSF